MRKKKYIMFFFSALMILPVCKPLFSQVNEEWVVRHNGSGNSRDEGSKIAVDGFGNIYVTGFITGIGTDWDYSTIKYNSAGLQLWEANYNGPGNYIDYNTKIALDDSGNVYVTGSSYVNQSNSDYATIKYNSDGAQQWIVRYSASANSDDSPSSIAIDSSGNVYVTGTSSDDYATIKYNSAGVQQWVTVYHGPGNVNIATSIALDDSGNAYVTGWSSGSGTSLDYATIKYDSKGVQQWIARYNGPINGFEVPYSIALDRLGNVYVTGYTTGGTDRDYATVKYNSAGVQQWDAIYDGPGNYWDEARSMVLDSSGNVYVTGMSRGIGTSSDYATIKYNSEGIEQWVKRYNGPGNSDDIASLITLDSSSNVYVTGYSNGTGTSSDYATIKYKSSSGELAWVKRYNGSGNSDDIAKSIVLDGSGNVYVTGASTGIGTLKDFVTIKYSQSTGISQISSSLPEQFNLSQNYPNPFNPMTIITYQLTMVNFVSLKVYNVLGNEVATLVNEKQSHGTYQIEFDGSNLPGGVYFYKITADRFTETKKLMLIK